MTMNTRHWMTIIIGVMSSVMTSAGYADHTFPSVVQYLEVNLLPAVMLIADWVAARWKDFKGVTGYASFMTAIKAATNASPELLAALNKAGIKIPA